MDSSVIRRLLMQMTRYLRLDRWVVNIQTQRGWVGSAISALMVVEVLLSSGT